MDACRSKQTSPPDDAEQQPKGDLDLIRRCYTAVLKHRDESTTLREFTDEVVFEILDWYPERLRKQIADHLLAGE